MSADNYIYIDKKRKPIEVWSCIASETCETYDKKDLDGQKSYLIGRAKNLEDAIKMAEDYEKELLEEGSYLEYGISFELWAK